MQQLAVVVKNAVPTSNRHSEMLCSWHACPDSKAATEVNGQLQAWNKAELRLTSFCYMDLPRVKEAVATRVAPTILRRVPSVTSLEPLSQYLGGLMVWCAEVFQVAAMVIEPWTEGVLNSERELPGRLFSVSHCFRSKGVGCWDGKDWRFGHIYRRAHGVTLDLIIDPSWICPGHGWSELRKGHATLGGIFIVESVNEAARTVVGRPVVLGNPASALTAAVLDQHGYPICRRPSGSTAL